MLVVIKSLTFILLMGWLVFWFVGRLRLSCITVRELSLWKNVWFVNQILAFLLPNIWFFFGALFVSCYFMVPKTAQSKMYVYILLLGSLPMMHTIVPGLGVLNYLFKIDYARFLSIFLLLPAFFLLKSRAKKFRLSSNSIDKYVFLFIALVSVLDFRDETITNGLRFLFLNFLDLFLPYYVVSRAIHDMDSLNKFLAVFLISVGILSLMAVFESVKHWHIYNHLVQHLIGASKVTTSEVRGGLLRAAVTFRTPIALGYVITIGFGLYLYMSSLIRNESLKKIIPLGLVLALICTVSRGPWVGLAFLCIIYIFTGREKLTQLGKLAAGGLITLPFFLMTSYGQTFIDLLPFVGTIRAETVDYRGRLFDMASIVIQRNFLFGSTDYINTPEMQTMLQGEGIVDVVNTYLQIALGYGWVGLILFCSIFLSLLWGIYQLGKPLYSKNMQLFQLGRALFSILCGIAITIYTVSSVDYIPHYYWVLFGVSSVYIVLSRECLVAEAKNGGGGDEAG